MNDPVDVVTIDRPLHSPPSVRYRKASSSSAARSALVRRGFTAVISRGGDRHSAQASTTPTPTMARSTKPYRQEDSHGFTVSLQSSHDMVEQAGRRSTYRPSRGEIPGAAVVDPDPGRTTIRCPRFAWNDVHLPTGATPMVMERRTTSRHVPTPGQYAGLPLPVAWPLIASVRPTRQAREVADESPSNCCQYPDF